MKDLLHVRIECDKLPGAHVRSLRGREAISELFELEVGVVFADAREIDAEALLGAAAEIVFARGDRDVRRVHGEISEVRDALESHTDLTALTVTLVPRAARLALNETSEIFLGKSVRDIVRDKLERVGLREGVDVEFRLLAEYPPCEHIVQYQETDLAFVCRLTENGGIAFSFEERDGRDVMVFTDANGSLGRIERREAISFHVRGEAVGIHRLDKVARRVPGRHIARDYNYRTPRVDVGAIAKAADAPGDVVEQGGNIRTPEEAARVARIRAEESLAQRTQWVGKSDVQELRAGARFRIEEHPRLEGELVVIEVRHRVDQVALGGAPGDAVPYENEFRAILASIPFRPPRADAEAEGPRRDHRDRRDARSG